MLTAIAGIITAVTGLILALNQILPRSSDNSTPAPAASPAADSGRETTPGAANAAYEVAFPDGTKARVGEFVYTLLGGHVEGQGPGPVELKITVRMTNEAPYGANFWDQSFRLLVDGVPRAPTGGLNEVVAGRSALEGDVVFSVPAEPAEFTLLVGENESQTVRIPVTLQPAQG